MIKHEIANEYLHVYFRNEHNYYSISLLELGRETDWRVAECREEIILVENVSQWTMHLMTSKNLSLEFALEFQDIVKQYCPDNKIDWDKTNLAMNIYDEFRKLRSEVKDDNETNDSIVKGFNAKAIIEIINNLKKKYHLN